MKTLKKIIICTLAVFMSLSVVACNNDSNNNNNTTDIGEINVKIVNKGYGIEWLKQIIAAYQDANPNCTVKLISVNDSAAAASKAQTAANDADILISTDDLFDLQFGNYLVDISDVYESVQEGYEIPVKDRMNQSFREYFEADDDKYYQMSWIESYSGFLYNKTEIDKVYGVNAYKLPNTTDELIAMSADLKIKGMEPVAMSCGQSYYDLIKYTWFAQYAGMDDYKNILKGYYKLGDGSYKACTTEAEFTEMWSDIIKVQ